MNAELNESQKYLLELFKEDLEKGINPKLYTFCEHVSRSGMMRHINVYYIKDNKPILLNWYIVDLGICKRPKYSDALKVGGCGMDMGFHIVYTLSRKLFQNVDFAQYKLPGRNGDKYETTDAGYILKQRWL